MMQGKQMKQNWERMVCLVVVLVILLGGGIGVSVWLRESSSGNASREIIPVVPRYLDLEKLNLFDKEHGIVVKSNPMAFVKKNTMIPGRPKNKSQKKATPAGQAKKAVKKAVPPASRPVQKKAPAMKKAAPAPRPKPQRPAAPPREISVVYTGIYCGLKQKNAAFLEIHDSKDKRSYSAVMEAGELIAGKFRIMEVSEKFLKIENQDAGAAEIRRDEVWKVKINE